MKKLMRFFGYVSILDIIAEVRKFDTIQTNKAEELEEEAEVFGMQEKTQDALDIRSQALGALRFVNEFISKQ